MWLQQARWTIPGCWAHEGVSSDSEAQGTLQLWLQSSKNQLDFGNNDRMRALIREQGSAGQEDASHQPGVPIPFLQPRSSQVDKG